MRGEVGRLLTGGLESLPDEEGHSAARLGIQGRCRLVWGLKEFHFGGAEFQVGI